MLTCHAEVSSTGQVISNLESQLKQSDKEMAAMGQETTRLTEELQQLSEQFNVQRPTGVEHESISEQPLSSTPDLNNPAEKPGPMAVAINLGDEDEVGGMTIRVSIACDESGTPRAELDFECAE